MPLSTWLALAFFLLAVGATAAIAVREAFRTFRVFGAVGSNVGSGLTEVESSLDEMTRRLDAVPAKGDRLTAELERLARSRAQLALLAARFADVRRTVMGLRTGTFGK